MKPAPLSQRSVEAIAKRMHALAVVALDGGREAHRAAYGVACLRRHLPGLGESVLSTIRRRSPCAAARAIAREVWK